MNTVSKGMNQIKLDSAVHVSHVWGIKILIIKLEHKNNSVMFTVISVRGCQSVAEETLILY